MGDRSDALERSNSDVRDAVQRALNNDVDRGSLEQMLYEIARDVRHKVPLKPEIAKDEDG